MTTINNDFAAAVKPVFSGDLKPQAAVGFLRKFHPGGPWVLSAIKDGNCRTATFLPGDETAVGLWIDNQQRDQRNVYFTPAVARGLLSRKAKKGDIVGTRYLWVDLDAPKGTAWGDPAAVDGAISELSARIAACPVGPTVVVNSGGGLQAYWRLEEQLHDAEQIEALNKALAASVGGDACHNIDRLMRLPGTVNWLNERKRAAGRVPAVSFVVSAEPGLAYSLEAFSVLRRVEGLQDSHRPRIPERIARMVQTEYRPGERSGGIYAAVCACFEAGLDEPEVIQVLEAYPNGVARKHLERGDLPQEVARIRSKWSAKSSRKETTKETVKGTPRRDIKLSAGEQARVVDETLEVIRDYGLMFERGGELVRRVGERLIAVEDAWLEDFLSRRVSFFKNKPDGNGDWVRTEADCPSWLCKRIAAKTSERGLHELHGIITAPTLRSDGSLLATPGFDLDTGLLLLDGDHPAIQTAPSREALKAAWEKLWVPFKEFPFVSPDDRAVAVAAILTALVRRTLPLAPAFSFDAPAAGSGKTILASCIASLTGGDLNIVPEVKEEEELRKRLIATLLEGHNHMLLDNIKGQFKSSALEAFMTGRRYSDRVLGASKMANLPTNVLVLISGNNFVPTSDLHRRVLTCRIDPRVEDAFRRSFDLDATAYCVEHRQELVAAGLTLLLGFQAAGAPRASGTVPLGSFETWDKMVRQCVLWMAREGVAELGDPIACISAAKEMDPERMRLVAFLTATHAVMGSSRWRTAELITRATTAPVNDLAAESLREILIEIAGSGLGAAINVRVLGAFVQKQVERRVGGLRVARGGIRDGNLRWMIVQD